MKQVVQVLGSGSITVGDVPVPSLRDRFVLVATSYSVISAGTEKSKVDIGKSSLLGKARARPDLVKQVLRKLRSEGLTRTLQTVSARLDTANPLGYSSAGKVIAVGGDVPGVQPGDWVACAGAGHANHAEFVAVPRNLIARIPDGVAVEEAAFCTLGAIALQGVRLCEPRLGETVFVLGLGLLGQVAVRLLRANGCRVLGTDLDATLCQKAATHGAIAVPSGAGLLETCRTLTAGRGVDSVLICAGTRSNEPIGLAAELCREQGRVVVIGAVGMDVPREPYFRKEISLVISRSYGPGRYDPSYEEHGDDYPYGYVRFTEQRNMETILQLVKDGSLSFRDLITHRFELDRAPEAYALIEGEKREPYIGIVLTYQDLAASPRVQREELPARSEPLPPGALAVSFCGAGNYATATLLPVLRAMETVSLRNVSSATGRSAASVAKRFGFAGTAAGFDDIIASGCSAVVIATRHDTHAGYVEMAIRAGIHAYVEKPLALSLEECDAVEAAMREHRNVQLMVGFNRRFAPLTRQLMEHFQNVQGPLVVSIRVNAGALPLDHWLNDPVVGGGRLIGEGCHFVDLASAIARSAAGEVHAIAAADSARSALTNDNLVLTLRMRNGSIATVTYASGGSGAMGKEFIEVLGGGRSAVLDDFRTLSLMFDNGRSKLVRLGGQDKGQRDMLRAWVAGLQAGRPAVSPGDLLASSRATIWAAESLAIGMPVGS